ncbi:hypothetical protein KW807_01240 [Candidatus Parcubacteria bacterium]|nr:hypothetical protein [Candidatus Parcubacteria bacterium]
MAVLWVHGPWNRKLVIDDLMTKIKEKICERDPSRIDQLKLNWGWREKVKDNEMWMALIVVAKEVPDKVKMKNITPMALVPKQESAEVVEEKPKLFGRQPVKMQIEFLSNEKKETRPVSVSLCKRWNTAVKSYRPGIRPEFDDMQRLREEVLQETGVKPDEPKPAATVARAANG